MWRQWILMVCVPALFVGCASPDRAVLVAEEGRYEQTPSARPGTPAAICPAEPVMIATDAAGQLAEPGSVPQISVQCYLLRLHGLEENAFHQALRQEAGITFAPEHLSAETRSRAMLGTSLAATPNRDAVFKAVTLAKTFQSNSLVNTPGLVVYNGHKASITIGTEVPVMLPTHDGKGPKTFAYLQEGRDIHVTPIITPDLQTISLTLSVCDATLEQLKPKVIEFGAEARVLAHVPIDGVVVIRTPFAWNEIVAQRNVPPGAEARPARVVQKPTKPLHDKKIWLYTIVRPTLIDAPSTQSAQ